MSSARSGPPNATSRTESIDDNGSITPRTPSGARAQLVHGVDDGRDMRERRIGKHPVAEVKDVTGPPGGTFQDACDLTANLLRGREQGDGIEVALDAHGRA